MQGKGLSLSPSPSPSTSLSFLGDAAHLGADVAQQEEGHGRGCTGDFGYPKGCAPAVVLGNGAERQACQEATHCGEGREGGKR